jgi:hypothetical protein
MFLLIASVAIYLAWGDLRNFISGSLFVIFGITIFQERKPGAPWSCAIFGPRALVVRDGEQQPSRGAKWRGDI